MTLRSATLPGHVRRRMVPIRTLAGLAFLGMTAMSHGMPVSRFAQDDAERVLARVGTQFVPNAGRHDKRVAFYATTFAGTVFVTKDGQIVYGLPTAPIAGTDGAKDVGWSLAERFVGGKPKPAAGTEAPTRVTHFEAGARKGESHSLPTYQDISLGDVWAGVHVRLARRDNNVERIYTVAPGAAVSRIRMQVSGTSRLHVGPDGELIAETGAGAVTYSAPIAYQDIEGERRPVAVSYAINGYRYGFEVGAYDGSWPLVIDPFLQSTYVPGVAQAGSSGQGINDLGVHPATGDVYMLATVFPASFPGTAGGAQPNGNPGSYEAVVARFNAELTTLLQATYYGGAGDESGVAMAVTDHGVYVLGSTESAVLPGVGGGAVTTGGQGFVVHLANSLTSIMQATFIDNLTPLAATKYLHDILAHPNGDIYVAGSTLSPTMRNTSGAFQPGNNGSWDLFIARFDGTLKTWVRTTFLGGSGADGFVSDGPLAVQESTGDIYVAGHTMSTSDFPASAGGARPTGNGGASAFVSRITADLETLKQSTYIYGRGDICRCDEILGLLVHPQNGDIYIAGDGSAGLPGVEGAAQSAPENGRLAPYVARLTPDLTAFVRTTYFGDRTDQSLKNFAFSTLPQPLAVHPVTGDIYLSGENRRQSLPGAAGGAQSTAPGGAIDLFIVRFNAGLTQRLQATYVGGSGGAEFASVLMIHPRSGDVYLAGAGNSDDIPGTAGGYLSTKPATSGSGFAGFIVRVSADLAATPAFCAGFADVPGTSAFCANVEWLKNRGVTLGCSTGQFCPASDVTRLAMAAFMNRLGTALTPVLLKNEAQPGAITLGAGNVVCQTGAYAISTFPSRAYINAVFMGTASAPTEFGADLVASLDGGVVWIDVGSTPGRATVAANQWANVRVIGNIDLWVGETVRLGLRITHGSAAGTASLADSRCTVRALVGNRAVINSPF